MLSGKYLDASRRSCGETYFFAAGLRSFASMRRLFAFLLLAVLIVGCGEKKEDPTKKEGFIDTSDPSTVQMPPLPGQETRQVSRARARDGSSTS